MIYILVIIFVITFAFYYTMTRSFTSPFSLLLLSFIMASTIIMSNIENWQVTINPKFSFYISLAIIAFAAGCIIADLLCGHYIVGSGCKCILPADIEKTSYSKLLFVFAPTILTVLFVFMSIRMGRGVITNGSVFRAIYEASATNSSSFLFHQLREIVVAIAEVSVIKSLKYKYLEKTRIPLLMFVPVVCFGICTMFSTDRNIFLRFIIYALCIWIFFKSSTSEKGVHSTNKDILKKTCFVLITAVAFFYFLGKIKNYTSNLERMIGIYGGSGLYNFNLSIDKLENTDPQLGKETFSQLIGTLRIFGIDLGDGLSNRAGLDMLVFRSPNGYVYASNIYSAMAPYMTDFGAIGIIIFPLVMGFIFKSLYVAALRKGSFYFWGLYSMLIYAVVYFTIAEQFFMRFHLGLLYEIGWFSIIYFVVFGSKNSRIIIK